MSLPETGPTTLAAVKELLSITDTRDDERLTPVVAAVNGQVRGWPVSARVPAEATTWPEHITLGATMLAARLWRRLDSPAGVAAFGDGGAAYVQRNDPDLAMLLQLGDWAMPAVG